MFLVIFKSLQFGRMQRNVYQKVLFFISFVKPNREKVDLTRGLGAYELNFACEGTSFSAPGLTFCITHGFSESHRCQGFSDL